MNMVDHSKLILIGFGSAAATGLSSAFNTEVITAPFGEDVIYAGDSLGDSGFAIFVAQELFQIEAAGILIDGINQTTLMCMMNSGLTFKVIELPIDKSNLNLMMFLYRLFPAAKEAEMLIDDLESEISRCKSDMTDYYLVKSSNAFENFYVHRFGCFESIQKIKHDVKDYLTGVFLSPDEFIIN